MMRQLSVLPKILLALTLVLFGVNCAFAGAWTAGKGEMYNKLSYNYSIAEGEFSSNSNRVDFAQNGKFTDQNITYYVEYGIIDKLTVFGSIPYKFLEYSENHSWYKSQGTGDVELGLKYNMYNGSYGVFSAQGLVKIPEFYDVADRPELGDGQYDIEARLLYGKSLYPHIPGYINIEIGYRYRFEEPGDQFRYLVEFGVDFFKKMYGRVKLDGIAGIGNGDDNSSGSSNPNLNPNFDLGKLDIALGYAITDNWAIEVGYTPSLWGVNTSDSVTYSFSLIYKCKGKKDTEK